MSGGVDSAVAAARAVEAGHDVVGVHLALSRMPGTLRTGSRGCCTIEDSRDAWRACDVLGIPYYVWDFSERFKEDVVQDFIDEYAAGRTPNPCMRCNERIKFAALLEKAIALGFDAVCTGPLRQGHQRRRRQPANCTAPPTGPRTRAMCWACSPTSSSSTPCSRWRTPRPRPRCAPKPSAAGCPWPTSRTATTSASFPTATPPAGWRRRST